MRTVVWITAALLILSACTTDRQVARWQAEAFCRKEMVGRPQHQMDLCIEWATEEVGPRL